MSYGALYTLSILVIASILIWIIPYILLARFIINTKTIKNIYPAILIGLFSMLLLNIAFIAKVSGLNVIYKTFDAISLLLSIITLTIVIRHTTSRLILGRELERVNGIFNTVVESSRRGLLILDEELNVAFANRRIGDLFLLDPKEIIGSPWKKVLGEKIKALFEDSSLVEKCGCLSEDLSLLQKEMICKRVSPSLLYISCHVDPLYDKKGRVIGRIITYDDVTEDVERIEREERLKERDRLRSHFISIVSHELKTPLTSLIGFTELMLSRVLDRETEKRYIEIVHNESKRLGALVDDILNLSRIEAGKIEIRREPFSIKRLLEEVVSLYRVRSEKHPIHLKVLEPLLEADGDREKLRQVLGNLIDNAIKYSPEGGDIDVKASLSNDMIQIEVKDRGIGIPEDSLQKIFEPFSRVDVSATRTTKGTGLGLTIAKKIVELHGGRIWVESRVGEGSSFYFTVPTAGKKG